MNSILAFNSFFCILNLAQMHQMQWYKEIQNVSWPTWPPAYNPKTNLNDIALVEVKSRFEWNRWTKPACLPSGHFYGKYEGSLMVSVSGFWLRKKDRRLT